MSDMFNLKSPDLVNLQKLLKRSPNMFAHIAVDVANDLAFDARTEAIKNISRKNTIRTPSFLKKSMVVDKAKHGSSLANVISSVGSIDISGKGLSTGFAEQEDGTTSNKTRVQTILGRTGGNKEKKVKRPVRMDKASTFHNKKQFGGKPATMLRKLRAKQIARKPVLIDQKNNLGMIPGVYQMQGKRLQLVQIFKARKRKAQAIHWMRDAANTVTETTRLTKTWVKRVEQRLPKTLK